MDRLRSLPSLSPGAKIYFMGIAGTGMAAAAGLLREAGYDVVGSDGEIYPPMSTMLEELGIPVFTPYRAQNLHDAKPDLVVVANALSRGHEEVEALLQSELPYTSFPELLGHCFLKERTSIVIAGTHGKTTTSSLMSHILTELGENPGFMIGGLPKGMARSFQVGSGAPFVIEGDEYDTAWFDKESKFLHYFPDFTILGNVEFDHADIFDDFDAVKRMFAKLLGLCQNPQNIVANLDNPGVRSLVEELQLTDKICRVGQKTEEPNGEYSCWSFYGTPDIGKDAQGRVRWSYSVETSAFGALDIATSLTGYYNQANIAAALGCLSALAKADALSRKPSPQEIERAVNSFPGVARRFEHLGTFADREVYEDFAHHPTAVKKFVESFRKSFPDRRLILAFEPRNATARRNIFETEYAEALGSADVVLLGRCPVDKRIPEAERMNTSNITSRLGEKAHTFDDNEELLNYLIHHFNEGDSVVFMSSGSFSGIQHKLTAVLADTQGKVRS